MTTKNTEITLEMIYEKLLAIENKLDKKETAKHNTEKLSPNNTEKKKIIIKKKDSVKTGSINMTIHPNGATITGDTFDKKNIIKTCKGWWTPEIKGWTVKYNNIESLKTQLEDCSKIFNIIENSTELQNIDIVDNKKNVIIKSNDEISPKSNIRDELDFLDDDSD